MFVTAWRTKKNAKQLGENNQGNSQEKYLKLTLRLISRELYDKGHIQLFQLTLSDQSLKGLRHEDFAILGQFCAKIIT